MVGTVIGEHSACSSKQDPDSRLFVPVSGGYVRPPEGMFSFGFVRFWLVFFVCSLDTVILSIYHLIMFLNRPLFIIADSVLLLLPFVHCTYISSSLLIYSGFFSTFNYFFFFFSPPHTLCDFDKQKPCFTFAKFSLDISQSLIFSLHGTAPARANLWPFLLSYHPP